ncbi:MAG TPA: NUDIX domain-containing protein [Streptosporangiaceae bacterium]|nr:NUDIX domain-containing protein [Streptosporangiaceae bacterium]
MNDLPQRMAARIVLLDPDDRVLLLRYDNGTPPNGSHWTTPGGGLNAGEDFATGAVRELAEETGWRDIALVREIYWRTLTIDYGGAPMRQHEHWYLARTHPARRPVQGVEATHAADGIAAWRWWTLPELDTTAETIWPPELATLVRSALRG